MTSRHNYTYIIYIYITQVILFISLQILLTSKYMVHACSVISSKISLNMYHTCQNLKKCISHGSNRFLPILIRVTNTKDKCTYDLLKVNFFTGYF